MLNNNRFKSIFMRAGLLVSKYLKKMDDGYEYSF